jgi:hypothetical protein
MVKCTGQRFSARIAYPTTPGSNPADEKVFHLKKVGSLAWTEGKLVMEKIAYLAANPGELVEIRDGTRENPELVF